MSAMQTAVQEVLLGFQEQESHEEIWSRFNTAVTAAEHATPEEGHWTLLALIELLAQPQCPYPALVACLCERGMSAGGDPGIALGTVIRRLYDTLVHADQFVQACAYQRETTGQQDNNLIEQAVAQERPRDALGFAELVISCGTTTPLLNHFPDARQLFRSFADAETILARLTPLHTVVQQLAQTLAQHTDPPMTPAQYHDSVDTALAQVRGSLAGGEEAMNLALRDLVRAVFCVELAVRNQALRGLGELVAVCDIGQTGTLSQLAGSFAEMGADPQTVLDPLLARLPEVLTLAGRFVNACVAAAQADGDPTGEPGDCIAEQGEAIATRMPLEVRAFAALDAYCLGVIALLSRSLEHRKEVQARSDLLPLVTPLAAVSGPASFLWKMVQILDDAELLVIVPAEKLGWRVRMSGVADNFQLHALVAGCVIGPRDRGLYPGLIGMRQEDGKALPVPGRPLDRRVVGVASTLPCREPENGVWSKLQLLTYDALRADGTLDLESDHFVWNEGIPADIPTFDDTRIVLLTEATMVRSWNGGRIFHGMRADLRVAEVLTVAAVENWLTRLRARTTK